MSTKRKASPLLRFFDDVILVIAKLEVLAIKAVALATLLHLLYKIAVQR
jgi:hypothetical protein